MVVEDSAGIRKLIRASVEAAGGSVVAEASGESRAVQAVSSLNPDLVVVDIRLEEGNGFGVIQRLRRQLPNLIIIVLTWQDRTQFEPICLQYGADYYFEKSANEYLEFEATLKALMARDVGAVNTARV
jgi:DNA-binding response OmpR family regulator